MNAWAITKVVAGLTLAVVGMGIAIFCGTHNFHLDLFQHIGFITSIVLIISGGSLLPSNPVRAAESNNNMLLTAGLILTVIGIFGLILSGSYIFLLILILGIFLTSNTMYEWINTCPKCGGSMTRSTRSVSQYLYLPLLGYLDLSFWNTDYKCQNCG